MDTPLSEVLGTKSRAIFSVSLAATVSEAAAEMMSKKIGAVLVLEGAQTVGMFTERDALYRVLAMGRDPKIRRLPVVQGGEIVGMISIGDLVRWVTRENDQLVDYITGKYPG